MVVEHFEGVCLCMFGSYEDVVSCLTSIIPTFYTRKKTSLTFFLLVQSSPNTHAQTGAYNGELVNMARVFGMLLNFNCALVLVPMYRAILTWLQGTALTNYVPFEKAYDTHQVPVSHEYTAPPPPPPNKLLLLLLLQRLSMRRFMTFTRCLGPFVRLIFTHSLAHFLTTPPCIYVSTWLN